MILKKLYVQLIFYIKMEGIEFYYVMCIIGHNCISNNLWCNLKKKTSEILSHKILWLMTVCVLYDYIHIWLMYSI